MSRILTTERATYEDIWSSVEHYGEHSPGVQALPIFLQIVGEDPLGWERTILDAGTGSGKAALELRDAGFDVRLCDVTNAGLVTAAKDLPFYLACLWHDLSPITRGFGHPGRTRADYVYCCDVLEHVPPQFTMLAVDQMLRVANKGVFLSVCLVPDTQGIWVGKALHQTVESFIWWRDALSELGEVVEARDLLNNAVFFVRRSHRAEHAGVPA